MSFHLSEDEQVDSSLELSLDHNEQLPSSGFNLTKEEPSSQSKITPTHQMYSNGTQNNNN